MDPLIAFRGNALGNLRPTRQQRLDAFNSLTATYRTKLEAMNGQGAAFKAALANAQQQISGGGASSAAKSAKAADTDDDSGTEQRLPNKELGKDAYLQLLVTQLSNQDPLAPMDNTAMVAQLAQFSALEQMQNLNDSFETLTGNVDQLNFLSSEGMLGRYVEGIDANKQPVKGIVRAVGLDGSIVMLDVDGKPLPMSGVLAIGTEAPASTSKGSSTKGGAS